MSAMTHSSGFAPSVPRSLLAVSVCVVLLCSCKHSQNTVLPEGERPAKLDAKVKKSVHNALAANTSPECQAWQTFLAHWPNARQYDAYAWDGTLKKFKAGVTATAIIEERYVFKISMDSTVSVDGQEVVFQQPRFRFSEVQAVRLPPKGAGHEGTITSFKPGPKSFELKEWNQLVEANWDFSKIGITIISNAPIPNIRAVPDL